MYFRLDLVFELFLFFVQTSCNPHWEMRIAMAMHTYN